MYPPEIEVVTASLTPTTVVQNQNANFEISVYNYGSAWANLDTSSYLELTNGIATAFISTTLAAPVMLPADTIIRDLAFSPVIMSGSVPPGTHQANLSLHWSDENGVTDTETFTNVGSVTVLGPPIIHAEPVPNPVIAGSPATLSFFVWNQGDTPGNVYHSPFDRIEISAPAAAGWGSFTPIASLNVPPPTDLWVGTSTGASRVTWTIISTYSAPYVWQPTSPPLTNHYAVFDIGTFAPTAPGIYTITVESNIENGSIVRQEYFPFAVVP